MMGWNRKKFSGFDAELLPLAEKNPGYKNSSEVVLWRVMLRDEDVDV